MVCLNALALRLSVSLFGSWAIHATLLGEHFRLPVIRHVTKIAAHLLNLWQNLFSFRSSDFNFNIFRAPCVTNRL